MPKNPGWWKCDGTLNCVRECLISGRVILLFRRHESGHAEYKSESRSGAWVSWGRHCSNYEVSGRGDRSEQATAPTDDHYQTLDISDFRRKLCPLQTNRLLCPLQTIKENCVPGYIIVNQYGRLGNEEVKAEAHY